MSTTVTAAVRELVVKDSRTIRVTIASVLREGDEHCAIRKGRAERTC